MKRKLSHHQKCDDMGGERRKQREVERGREGGF